MYEKGRRREFSAALEVIKSYGYEASIEAETSLSGQAGHKAGGERGRKASVTGRGWPLRRAALGWSLQMSEMA
jgi:hypothetical protein